MASVQPVHPEKRHRAKDQEPKPWECLFLAMPHQRLGHDQQAHDYLAKAETWMAAADKEENGSLGGIRPAWEHWRDRLMAQTLHQEAAALIKTNQK